MERGFAWSGLGVAALAVASTVVLGDADTASRGAVRVSAFFFVVGMVVFVIFASTVAACGEGRASRYAVLGLGSGSAVLQVAGVMPRVALNYRVASHVDSSTQRLLLDLSRVTNFYSDLVLAAFLVVGTLVLSGAVRSFRPWSFVGYVGAATAAVAAASTSDGPGLLTLAAFVIWLVGASITLARKEPASS